MGIFDRFRRKKVYEHVPTPERQQEIAETVLKQIQALGISGAQVKVIPWSASGDYSSWAPDPTSGSMPIGAIKPPTDNLEHGKPEKLS